MPKCNHAQGSYSHLKVYSTYKDHTKHNENDRSAVKDKLEACQVTFYVVMYFPLDGHTFLYA